MSLETKAQERLNGYARVSTRSQELAGDLGCTDFPAELTAACPHSMAVDCTTDAKRGSYGAGDARPEMALATRMVVEVSPSPRVGWL